MFRTKMAKWRAPDRYRAVFVDELPDTLEALALYAVGEQRRPWLAAMACPC
jgi:hypothetical protein